MHILYMYFKNCKLMIPYIFYKLPQYFSSFLPSLYITFPILPQLKATPSHIPLHGTHILQSPQ